MRRYPLPLTDGPPLQLGLRFAEVELTGAQFTPDSDYVEFCWLPTLGPTSLWVGRRIYALLDQHYTDPDGEPLLADVDIFATAMGVRTPVLCRALDRLVVFGVAVWDSLDPTCPLMSLYQRWPKAPTTASTRAASLRPITGRNPDGTDSPTTGDDDG